MNATAGVRKLKYFWNRAQYLSLTRTTAQGSHGAVLPRLAVRASYCKKQRKSNFKRDLERV